jgi:hypothetical protein
MADFTTQVLPISLFETFHRYPQSRIVPEFCRNGITYERQRVRVLS